MDRVGLLNDYFKFMDDHLRESAEFKQSFSVNITCDGTYNKEAAPFSKLYSWTTHHLLLINFVAGGINTISITHMCIRF